MRMHGTHKGGTPGAGKGMESRDGLGDERTEVSQAHHGILSMALDSAPACWMPRRYPFRRWRGTFSPPLG